MKVIKFIFFYFFIDLLFKNFNLLDKFNPDQPWENKFNKNWLRDNTKKNISYKNPYYGEYTFHYWLWKNSLEKFKKNEWVGFCAYRRFWVSKKKNNIKNLNDFISQVPSKWNKYDVIIGQNIYLNWKFSKLIKNM